jgi:hypothetical protein
MVSLVEYFYLKSTSFNKDISHDLENPFKPAYRANSKITPPHLSPVWGGADI